MIKGKLFTDGGARGNPGPSAIGCVLYINEQKVDSFSECIGKGTNNQAEYKALLIGLELAQKNKVEELDCFLLQSQVIERYTFLNYVLYTNTKNYSSRFQQKFVET